VLSSCRDDLSTISSCSTIGAKSLSKSIRSAHHENSTRLSSSSQPSLTNSRQQHSTIPSRSSVSAHLLPKNGVKKTTKKVPITEKDISKKFLRMNDLDLQINETEAEIRRLHSKQKKDQERIEKVLKANHRAMEEIEGTQEELLTIYDVTLQVRDRLVDGG
jgi:hypothetical protein